MPKEPLKVTKTFSIIKGKGQVGDRTNNIDNNLTAVHKPTSTIRTRPFGLINGAGTSPALTLHKPSGLVNGNGLTNGAGTSRALTLHKSSGLVNGNGLTNGNGLSNGTGLNYNAMKFRQIVRGRL